MFKLLFKKKIRFVDCLQFASFFTILKIRRMRILEPCIKLNQLSYI